LNVSGTCWQSGKADNRSQTSSHPKPIEQVKFAPVFESQPPHRMALKQAGAHIPHLDGRLK
jgi:hypothetical protein